MHGSHRCRVACLAVIAILVSTFRAHAAGLDPADWRGDVRFLTAAVDSIHPRPHRWAARAAWDSAATDLERRLPGMRYDEAVAGFARLLGLLRDGHSRLGQIRLPSHGRPALDRLPGPGFDRTYPIEFEVFADGLWVTRARREYASIVGTHVVAIDGRSVPRALELLSPMIPAENPMWTLRMFPAFLRSPGYLDAAGLVRGPRAPLRLETVDMHGRAHVTEVRAEAPDTSARWITADDSTRAPAPLARRLSGPFAFADLGDSARTVFVRIQAIVNDADAGTFAAFVARLFAHTDSIASRRLILDLRGNGGGNNYLIQPLVHGVLRRVELDQTGRLFVIVDRGTFSAAVSLAAELQRETHALFVGEPTGEAPNSPGDPARVTLPASGLEVRISTIEWQMSDPRDPRLFIAPDLPAMPRWSDWLEHRDPALAAIAAYRRADSPPDTPPNTHWGSPSQLRAEAPAIAW